MSKRIYPGNLRLARAHLAIGHHERAYELDPSLRPSPVALDAATEEAIDCCPEQAIAKR